jgi:hypothetical protein
MKVSRNTVATLLTLALAALLALPALAPAGKGKRVAKDVGKGKSAVAVARATIKNPGVVRTVISTKPRRKRVEWSYVSVCTKNGRSDRYPGPGDATTRTTRSKIKRRLKLPMSDPDRCQVDVAAKLPYRSGKRVIAKIFNKG